MKDKIFFPLILLIAFVAIYFAIKPPQLSHLNSVSGQIIKDKIVISGNELNAITAKRPFIARENTRVNGNALGPRIIAEEKIALNGMNGAKIIFADNIVRKLANKKFKLIIIALPIRNIEPKNIGIAVFGDDKTYWQNFAAPKSETPLIIDFNGEISNPQGILINPSLEGGAKGIELQAIAIKIIE